MSKFKLFTQTVEMRLTLNEGCLEWLPPQPVIADFFLTSCGRHVQTAHDLGHETKRAAKLRLTEVA
jgi:hypothetical protein